MAKTKSKWMSNPTVSGWYWWRKDMKNVPTSVIWLTAFEAKFADKTGQWYGPIKEPK
jgi:hypothetical protein